ncbi:MAG: lamin tail domain-containing protein, partial [Planctomycetales bacterium]|nr:lamin tail domain-containing protein [Planctomycetales bacterium]
DDAGSVTYIVDDVHFAATLDGQGLARFPNAMGRLAPAARTTLGCTNRTVGLGPVLISEVNYRPTAPTPAQLAIYPALTVDDLEYVEVHNASASPIDLTDWRLRGGVDFDFPAGAVLMPNEVALVLPFNPENPANATRLAALGYVGVRLFGGYAGQLDDFSEELRLLRPDTPPVDNPTLVPHVIADLLVYDDVTPWPQVGTGISRVSPILLGDLSSSWTGASTPGAVAYTLPTGGDVTGDGVVNGEDIDLLFDHLAGKHSPQLLQLDVDGNGSVNANDVQYLVTVHLGTLWGDANLDGSVDGTDLNIWNQSRFSGCGSWSSFDFNGDTLVDVRDFNLWNANKFLSGGDGAPSSASTADPRATLAVDSDAAIVSASLVLDEPQASTHRMDGISTLRDRAPSRSRLRLLDSAFAKWYDSTHRNRERFEAPWVSRPAEPSATDETLADGQQDEDWTAVPRHRVSGYESLSKRRI